MEKPAPALALVSHRNVTIPSDFCAPGTTPHYDEVSTGGQIMGARDTGSGKPNAAAGGIALLGLMLLLAPASAAAAEIEFLDVQRDVETSADYSLDSSYLYTFDYQDDADAFSGPGAWDIGLESRVYAYEGAPDGVGRVEVTSRVSSDRIAFASRLRSEGGYYSTEGGDPNDVGSYYFTNEETWGAARSSLVARFRVPQETIFSMQFAGVGRSADEVEDLSFELSRDLPYPIPGFRTVFYDENSLVRDVTDGTPEISGLLEPGYVYTLELDHRSVQGGDMALDFLLIVPEPGTALLLGLGLAGLAVTRRHA